MMRWSDVDISFGPQDHLDTKLSDRNLPFVIKLPIGQHKVAKTLIDNRALVNLIMRKIFIEMGLNLKDLTPVHDIFHGVIPGQSSTPIRCIDLEVPYGIGDNKCKEVLTFKVASFDIVYNCILGRPFLLMFMTVIHTAYVTLMMPDPKVMITIKADQCDTLACDNATLTHAGQFDKKVATEQAAKIAKTHDGTTTFKSSAPKPSMIDSPRPPSAKKGAYGALASNQQPIGQSTNVKKKEADDREVPVGPSNPDKKLQISTCLETKYERTLITFVQENLDVFVCQISDMLGIPREVIEHKLGIDPSYKLIKQKERRYTPERHETIR
jgi:hypothetical protein